MEKKEYRAPEVEVVTFAASENIMSLSGNGTGGEMTGDEVVEEYD